jgi:non-ribosomal peptide synthetase component F
MRKRRRGFESPVRVDELPDESVDTVAGDPDDPAYVFYTSGSTGTPKGVPLRHRNAMAFLNWAAGAFTPEELAGSLAGASVSFDFSILEIFAPLLGGGTVFLGETVFALPDLAERDEIRMICGPPSAIGVLLSRPLPGGVRTVVLGGETLTTSLVERVFANPSVQRVLNPLRNLEDGMPDAVTGPRIANTLDEVQRELDSTTAGR